MYPKDYHIHTVYSDGADTPEQVVLAAIEKGLAEIGFSDHSYISLPSEIVYWKGAGIEPLYKAEIARLKEKYKGKIKISCGIEQDVVSDHEAEGYDYIIGAVHFVKAGDILIGVDEPPEYTLKSLKYFGGDIYTFIEEYYKLLARVVETTKCDIIAHFDLIAKYNDGGVLFDESNPRYIKAWQAAADALLKTKKPFEINTGAVARGVKAGAYPSEEIIEYLKSRGGKFILAGDSHRKEDLCFGFEKYETYVRKNND